MTFPLSKLSVGSVGRGAVLLAALFVGACSSTGDVSRDSGGASVIEPASSSANENMDGFVFDDIDVPPQRSVDLTIEPNLDEIPERIVRGYERAHAAMHAKNWSEAELELEQLILDEPGFPGIYVNLAIVYRHSQRLADAKHALEQAIAIDPTFAPASSELGLILRESGEFAAAEMAYRQAVDADPGYALAQYNFGILLDLYLRRPAEALPHYLAYQNSLAEPDAKVARWIIDVERRAKNAGLLAQD